MRKEIVLPSLAVGGGIVGLILRRWELATAFEADTGHKLVAGPEACDYTCLYQSVMGKGELTLLTDDNDRRHALERVMAHYTGREGWDYMPQYYNHMAMLRLTVREWSCKVHD